MPFVTCSVDGCNRKLQPLLKPDPRDRDTWVYRECDVCFRPACAEHSTETDGRLVCDRCRREIASRQPRPELLDLGIRLEVGPRTESTRPRPRRCGRGEDVVLVDEVGKV